MGMQITENNYQEAYTVKRDVLYMFVDLVESYGGFGHSIDTGTFDPTSWYALEIFEPDGICFGVDCDLIQIGSAIAMLCTISDAWDEAETWDISSSQIEWAKKALDNGFFEHLPIIEKAFNSGLSKSAEGFQEALQNVYQSYVLSYFKKLAINGC